MLHIANQFFLLHLHYIDELNHFIGIIRDEKKTNVTIDDSVQSMLVLNAIVESSEKEKVIHLGNYRK